MSLVLPEKDKIDNIISSNIVNTFFMITFSKSIGNLGFFREIN